MGQDALNEIALLQLLAGGNDADAWLAQDRVAPVEHPLGGQSSQPGGLGAQIGTGQVQGGQERSAQTLTALGQVCLLVPDDDGGIGRAHDPGASAPR